MLAGLGGCVVGNNSKLQRPTIGQELIDLQKAKESGAIDEAEYDRTRARILEDAGVESALTPNDDVSGVAATMLDAGAT
jgi:hypothetical protein